MSNQLTLFALPPKQSEIDVVYNPNGKHSPAHFMRAGETVTICGLDTRKVFLLSVPVYDRQRHVVRCDICCRLARGWWGMAGHYSQQHVEDKSNG